MGAALRWSGWGVAAVLTFLMLRENDHPADEGNAAPITTAKAKTTTNEPSNKPVQANPPAPSPASVVTAEMAGLRQEVVKLRKELEALRTPDGTRKLIAITQFRRPGEAPGTRQPNSLVSLLSASLQPLLTGGGSHATGPEIVVERGFGAFTAESLPEGYYYRHKRFPAEEWEVLGLMRDADQRFYDPSGGLIWSADPAQPGTYVSTEPEPGQDLSGFVAAQSGNIAVQQMPAREAQPQPSVMAVTDPNTGEGRLLISHPETLQPKVAGQQPVIWIGIKGANGQPQWLPVGGLTLPPPTPQQNQLQPGAPSPQRFAAAAPPPPNQTLGTSGTVQTLSLNGATTNALLNSGAVIGVSFENQTSTLNLTQPSTNVQVIAQP